MIEKVEMTAEERQEFEAATTIPQLRELSEQIKLVKETIFGNFEAILKMKTEITGVARDDQNSHTFTNSDSTLRVILGVNTIDGYRDTVEDGIAMVKGYIESLAKDDATKALVNAVLRLLSRDGQGNIKASRVLQLRKMAEDSGNEQFLEGVKIIEEAYQPTISKKFIRAQYKNDKGAWCYIPLGMTDVD